MRNLHGRDPRPQRLKGAEHVKKIRLRPGVAADVRMIAQPVAIGLLKALHHYARTGQGRVKPLTGEFEGLKRLRVANHRVVFEETADEVIVHRIRDRKNAYQ